MDVFGSTYNLCFQVNICMIMCDEGQLLTIYTEKLANVMLIEVLETTYTLAIFNVKNSLMNYI